MNKIDDGGRAFPRPTSIDPTNGTLPDGDDVTCEQDGMTLREHFAGVALTGLLARKVTAPAADLASQAYELADALIAARNLPAVSEREKLMAVITDITTEAGTAASAMHNDKLRAVLLEINLKGNKAIREARGM